MRHDCRHCAVRPPLRAADHTRLDHSRSPNSWRTCAALRSTIFAAGPSFHSRSASVITSPLTSVVGWEIVTKLPDGTASTRARTSAAASSSSGTKLRMPSNITATGRSKSSVRARSFEDRRRLAQVRLEIVGGALRDGCRAAPERATSTIGSLST